MPPSDLSSSGRALPAVERSKPNSVYQATCQCGHKLFLRRLGTDRIVCPGCGSRIRVRLPQSASRGEGSPTSGPGLVETSSQPSSDGYLRFDCPCGRRLKVSSEHPPKKAQCPECRRIMAVPAPPSSEPLPATDPEVPTLDLDPSDLHTLNTWAEHHHVEPEAGQRPNLVRRVREGTEVGLRVCSHCQAILHLAATSCPDCGTPAPRSA